MGILQARILEWVAMSSSRGSSQPRAQTHGPSHRRQILYHLSPQGSPLYQQSLQFPHLYGILFFSSRSFSLTHEKKNINPSSQVLGFSYSISPTYIMKPIYITVVGTWVSSVQFSFAIVSNSLRPRGLQHTRLPCPSSTAGAYSNSCPLSRWCHPTISSSVIPFSSCLQSFPSSGCFQMSQFFKSGGQSVGVSVSASFLPMNIQDWFPLEWTGWIYLKSKGLSRVFSNTTVQKHQFFGTQLSLYRNSHIHTWLLENHCFDEMDLCWQSNVSYF